MTDYSNTDVMLDGYSEAFDLYIERREMPPVIDPEDKLAGYMREVIDNNMLNDKTDETWVEVMKEGLISYFSVLLKQLQALQQKMQKELEMIQRFRNADIEKKREMWKDVASLVGGTYSMAEVNIEGYVKQFKTEESEKVLKAFTDDWEQACRERCLAAIDKTVEVSKGDYEHYVRTVGDVDYKAKRDLENYVFRYPQLKEIVDMIGRDKKSETKEIDSIVYKFMPRTVSKNVSVEEIDRVVTGDNLERVIPIELSMPDDLFFKRYATKELQQFSSMSKDKPQKVAEKKKEPRLDKGPIIVAIDTSYSMSGRPEKIAFSLLKQLLRMAKKQKRPCFLISFSVRAASIDLAKPANWGKLDTFLKNGFSGGTDGEQMLAKGLDILAKGTYEMADMLVISDLEFPTPKPATQERIKKEKTLGTRFYALQIGGLRDSYKHILDKIWRI